ncbi:uncharacterized protein LOC123014475 [Tribolium madens]|uniref:uncharacterized protein LOC123014475 n=1 Tax=Tribolium madens TaxID=41895 RepID=UPI001CF741F7|nr:uncharacterized protein LOC123014475 [Tribolium madens]
MFKAIVFAAFLALAVAAPAPQPTVVGAYSAGVVAAPAVAYSVPAVSTYAAAPVVSSYGVHPVGYSAYGYGHGVPVAYY